MKPFTTLTGLVGPMDRPNVDTDQIIPKQFLKRILFAFLASLYLLAGCNTIEGMGKDIQKGGEKIEEAAKKK